MAGYDPYGRYFPSDFTEKERRIVKRVVVDETRNIPAQRLKTGKPPDPILDRSTGVPGLDAEDFFQRAVFGVWEAKRKRGPEGFESLKRYHNYLRKAARNRIRDAIREARGRPRSESSACEWPVEVDNLVRAEEMGALTDDCVLFGTDNLISEDEAQEGCVRKSRRLDVSKRSADPPDDAIYNEAEQILGPVIRWTMALPDDSKDRLTRPEFRCLIRKVVDGDSIPEIARGLRIKEESVVKNLDRAVAKLRRANDPELDRFLTDNYLD